MPPRKPARAAPVPGSSEGAGGADRARIRLEPVAIERLNPAPYNPRSISRSAMKGLETSIDRWGLVQPVVWNKRTGNVVGGHQRLKVLQKGGAKTVDVVVVDLDDGEEKALNVTLNSPLISGEFTEGTLGLLDEIHAAIPEMSDLLRMPDLRSMLRRDLDLKDVVTPDGPPAPPPPKNPVTKAGDLWILGEHRILCGDSGKPQDVARLMDSRKAVLFATDPPYGVAYDNAERPNPGVAKPRVAKPRVANDELTDGPAMQAFLEKVLAASLPYVATKAAFYFWHPMLTQGTYVAAAAAAAGILIHRQIIWVKPAMLLGRGDYHWQHELCFYGWRKGSRAKFFGRRNQTTIWAVGRDSDSRGHGHATVKPVELFAIPIRNHTRRGDVVMEPFSGSGTQIVAAQQLERRCCAMELSPAFVDVAVARWEQMTGRKAERA